MNTVNSMNYVFRYSKLTSNLPCGFAAFSLIASKDSNRYSHQTQGNGCGSYYPTNPRYSYICHPVQEAH